MFCGHCGRQIPDDSVFCPLCGASLKNQTQQPAPSPAGKDFSQEPLSRYGQPSYQSGQAPAAPAQNAPQWQTGQGQYSQGQYGQAQGAQPQQPAAPAPNAQWQTGQVPYGQGQYGQGQFQTGQWQNAPQGGNLPPFQQYEEPGKGKRSKKQKGASTGKKKKGLVIGGICGGIVLVLALVAVFFWSQVSNFFVRTFSSPDKYYQFVEGRNIEDTANTASTIYDQVVLKNIDMQDRRVEFDMSLKPEEPLLDLLNATGMRMDFDWLEQVKVSGSSNFSEGMGKAEEIIYLNDDKILSLNEVLDSNKNIYYLQVPEFSEDWIKFDPYSMMTSGQLPISMGSTIYSASSVLSQLSDILPDEATANNLMKRYGQIVLDQVKGVSKQTETLKIKGVSGKYTALSYEIDEDDMKDILAAVFDAVKDDKEIEDIIKGVTPIYAPMILGKPNADEDDFYDYVIDQLEKAEDKIDDIKMDDSVEMKVWVDGSGEIVARKINYGDYELFMGMSESGGKFGLELSYSSEAKYNEGSISLSGSGTKKGDKLTGTLTLEVMEKEYAEIKLEDFDKEQAKKGFLDGKLVIYPTKEAFQAAGLSRYLNQFKSILSDVGILVEGKTTESEGKITLQILTDDEPFLTISMESKTKKAEEVDKVKGAVDYMTWIQNIKPSDLEDFVDDLDKTDLPDELIDYLRNSIPGRSSSTPAQ